MHIGLTYDLKQDYLDKGFSAEQIAEFDCEATLDALESSMRKLGHSTSRIGNVHTLMEKLSSGETWDLVFNIAEGLYGYGREAQVPAILDAFKIPYTFADPLTMSTTLHKATTKKIVRYHGVPTADFAVVEKLDDLRSIDLPYPLFAKPVAEGTSKGITASSKITSKEQLQSVCSNLLEKYQQPVLLETYLSGREFTVCIVGTGENASVLGTMEILLKTKGDKDIYSYNNKQNWEECVDYQTPNDGDVERSAVVALEAWKALGCRDAGRIDIRLDSNGVPNFIEANPLAGLNPDYSDLPILCGKIGVPYIELISKILESASKRVVKKQLEKTVTLPTPKTRRSSSQKAIML